jgi:hypothetical protein
MNDLWPEIQRNIDILDSSIGSLRKRGQNYAKYEHDYRVMLSKRLTELRAEGNPVTHLADIAKGEPEIAKARMERDIAESLYQSCLEGINFTKLKLRLLEGQLSREWTQAGREK